MKKIYLLIIVLISGLGFAQSPPIGSYEIVFNGWAYGDEHHNCGAASVTLEFSTPADNRKVLDITYTDDRATTQYADKKNTFKADKIPVSMFFSASRYDRQSCNGNRPHNSGRIYSTNKFRCFDYNFEFKQFKNVENSGDGLASSFFNVKVRPILVILDKGSGNELPTEKKITIDSHTGFAESEYNWQYSFDFLDPDSWADMDKFYGKSSITTNAKEILGEDAGKYHGRQIYFRQKACDVFSPIVTYIIRQSAPEIVTKAEEKTKCFDTQDGKLTLKFSRPLFDGEKITFSIRQFDEAVQKWQSVVCSSQQDDEISLDGTNSYKFPCDFAKGKYGIAFTGFINGSNTGSPHTEANPYIFNIDSPAPVDFSLSSTNVNCYGSADGTLTINASGGSEEGYQYSLNNGTTWIPFTDSKSTKEILKGLFPITKPSITYSIIVKDKKDCIAMLNNKAKVLSETITEPLVPLALKYTDKKDPTFFGASDGRIVASITGGTPNDDKSYNFEWTDNLGNKLATTGKYDAANKVYNLTLEDVPAGNYKLTVMDKNYAAASNKTGCSIVESSQVLTAPDLIKLRLKIRQAISCNSANLGEKSSSNKASASNGSLVALAEGGKILDTKTNKGLPYYFSWKKLNEATGNWDDLDEEKDSIVSDRSKGLYSVNVTDANGIMHGTYTLTEQTPIAVELPIDEPDEMKIVFTSGNVSCFEGTNGWAKASIKDGKSTYTYTWYLPDNIKIKNAEIKDLIKGKYYVEAVDNKKGCFVRDSIIIDGPTAPLALKYLEVTPPTFAGGANGKIVAEITGGTPYTNDSYNFKWINKDKTQLVPSIEIVGKKGDADHKVILTLEGLPASVYSLTVTDENYRDIAGQIKYCSIIDSQKELDEPKPLKVTFERKEISCNSGNEFGSAKDTSPSDGQRDESQDGMLIAHVTGGTTLFYNDNKGLPYFYHWKKQEPNGTWKDLETIKDSIATNLSDGNYALNVEDRHKIILGTYVNGSWTAKDSIQPMKQPLKLVVTITKGDVFCNGGNDGWATAKGAGGTGPYTYIWSNGVEIAENTILKKGKYTVYVTDFRGCTTQQSITISEPEAPLSIKYTEVLNPSFYKATNGKIVAEITGGTIFSDKTYWFEWKNSKGIKQTSITAQFNNGVYTITLNGVPEDTYSLTIRDANYVDAVNKTGCTMINSVTALDDPDPLEVTLEVVRTISCNVNNEFGNEADVSPLDKQRDESQDGILVARVKGGIPLEATKNKGLLYYYTWKKKQKDGSWASWNDHDETAENLSDGIYALNIEDANGIKLGTYVNNTLVKEIDITQNMPQPAQLKLAFTKLDVGCTTGDDGWAEAQVSGGTSPYTYEWTNEATTARIENLTSNNYFVKVTDAKGCVVQGSIFVGDPNGVMAAEKLKNPTCFDGNDGAIQLTVSGGNLPYTYKWNTGDSTKDIAGLKAGNYEVTITCPDCCVYKKKFVLVNPNKITIDLGPDRTLCNDQALELNAAIADEKAQYLWTSTNGFTASEAKVSLSKAGTYHVKAISGLGCIIEDEIVIKTSQAIISSEFLLSSQAYLDEEVILVNTSNPYGENTEWIIPNGVKIVEKQDKYITLKFEKTGVYAIGLKQTQGDCYAIYNKNITVEERSGIPNTENASKFITGFIVTPNPNDGNFKAIVTLENNSPINLRLFSTTGQNTMIQKKESGKKKYEVDFGTSLAAGMYVLVLETAQQTLVKKIIIY
ncbi:T9SS type A sorting domain-containing protein [Flavobacterium sp. LC2016-01]|uniref:T9SS type A sorting domain-containing protein n=1 Tax=Flavobacterium sp. LC2016-01 TaxID=2675876 RepID=UPI0018ACF535|nr:T9SS type A sorting domain-containing protein [Flavobacterium sp. LC2016-01]